jgi:hypothetical protein
MMVGYVHHTTKLWKLWDPEFKKVLHVSDVVFDEDVNCYVSCPTPTDSLDPFGLPQQEPIHIEYIDMPTHDEVRNIRAAITDNVIGGVEAGVTAVAEKAGNAVADNATGRDAAGFPQWLKKPVAE